MKTIKHMNKFIVVAGLLGTALLFQSCGPAYVSFEPATVEMARPQRPTETHIWIEGDWVWSSSTRMYVQNNGYWAQPQRDRQFVRGHWERTPKGHYWVAGRWERQDHKDNNGRGRGRGNK